MRTLGTLAGVVILAGLAMGQLPVVRWQSVSDGNMMPWSEYTSPDRWGGPGVIRVVPTWAEDASSFPSIWLVQQSGPPLGVPLNPWAASGSTHIVAGGTALIIDDDAMPPWRTPSNPVTTTASGQAWLLEPLHPNFWLESNAPVLVWSSPLPHDMPVGWPINTMGQPHVPICTQSYFHDPAQPDGLVLSDPQAFVPTPQSVGASFGLAAGDAVEADVILDAVLPLSSWSFLPVANVLPGDGCWFNSGGLITRGAPLSASTASPNPDPTLFASIEAYGAWSLAAAQGTTVFHVSVTAMPIQWAAAVSGPGWSAHADLSGFAQFGGTAPADGFLGVSAGHGGANQGAPPHGANWLPGGHDHWWISSGSGSVTIDSWSPILSSPMLGSYSPQVPAGSFTP